MHYLFLSGCVSPRFQWQTQKLTNSALQAYARPLKSLMLFIGILCDTAVLTCEVVQQIKQMKAPFIYSDTSK